ncbi:MAG: FAD-binding oxidoreductase [Pelagimonas sp.]|jgi:glycine/D-amino acid oxidase-like deaminating enzyme|nr:FAD-binding oxidoreductase [Pelagimonas sp.]
MTSVDVTVRGAGAFGLSVAWACVQRGAKVRVVDPYGPGAGSSGGLVGALAPHVPENWNPKKAFQFESLIMAEGFWQEVEAEGGVSAGYGRTGRLQPIADDHTLALAQERALGAQELWQGKAEWRVVSCAEAGNFAPDSPTGLLIYDTLTARMRPRGACDALVAALNARGTEITTQASDEGAVVWATGWQGLRAMSEELGKKVGDGVKGQSALFRYEARQAPQIFAQALHIIPHADGTVAVGSTSEREFDDPNSTDAQTDELIARARDILPDLKGAEVIARWAGVRPRAKTRAPILGAWPDRPGHYVANGGFKIGFGMAPKVAQVMADLILEGRDEIPEGFRVAACM